MPCLPCPYVLRDGNKIPMIKPWEAPPEELRGNREAILEAVRVRGSCLQFASETLKNDRTVVLEAVKQDGKSLEFAGDELRNDKEVVIAAIVNGGNKGSALKYASEVLRGNKEVVLLALRQDGMLLEYVDHHVMFYEEIARVAIKQNPMAIVHVKSDVQEKLTHDEEFIFETFKSFAKQFDMSQVDKIAFGIFLKSLGDSFERKYNCQSKTGQKNLILYCCLKGENEFFLEVLKDQSPEKIEDMNRKLSDKKSVMEMIQSSGNNVSLVFRFASEDLQRDKEILYESLRRSPMEMVDALRDVAESSSNYENFMNDNETEIVLFLIQIGCDSHDDNFESWMSEVILAKEIVRYHGPKHLQKMPSEMRMKMKRSDIGDFLSINLECLNYFDERYRNDEELITVALKRRSNVDNITSVLDEEERIKFLLDFGTDEWKVIKLQNVDVCFCGVLF